MAEKTLLFAQNLTRYYHGRQVLYGIDLALYEGEIMGFLGPNGAGKTTTMNILSGVLTPHRGSVSICGHDMRQQPLKAKRQLGYLPEVPPLHLDATVDEYLLELKDWHKAIIGFGFLFTLPTAFVLNGFFLWWRRRRA